MRNKLFFRFLFLFVGCASNSEKINLIHMQEANDFADEKSVFYINENLTQTNKDILLNSQIKLPKKIKIAVIKLQPKLDTDEYKKYRIDKSFSALNQNDSETFLLQSIENLTTQLRNHEIKTVLVPESLIPPKAHIRWIQNLGITMQADLILVVDSRNDRYRDMQIIKNNVAMSISSADAYLIDSRTGAIISTNSYTKEAFTEKSDKDFDSYQTLNRARSASEKKIYKKLAGDLFDTLNR